MAATNLTSSGVSGSLSGSAVSASISVSPLFNSGVFSAQMSFPAGAAGTLTVTKSIDGGSTFAPIMAGALILSAVTKQSAAGTQTGVLNFISTSSTDQFRIEASLTSGTVSFALASGLGPSPMTLNLPPSMYFRYRGFLTATAAQIQKLYELRFTDLSASDVAGLTTAYKTAFYLRTNADLSQTKCTAFVKLSIPADAARAKYQLFYLGYGRELRAQFVDVMSVVDCAGNPVPQAVSSIDPQTVYAAGQRITSRDLYGSSTGDLTASTNYTGIHCYPTLLEAVDGFLFLNQDNNGGAYPAPLPDLTALGL